MDETPDNIGDLGEGERVRRPPLERTAPYRGLLPNLGAANGGGLPGSEASLLSDITRASIETAYRVVDAQFEYGRRVAAQLGFVAPQPGPNGANGQVFDSTAGAPIEELFKTYATTFAELTSVWFRIMLQVAAQTQPQPPAAPASPSPAPAEPARPSGDPSETGAMPEPRRIFIPLDLRPGEQGRIETPPLGEVDPQRLRASAARSRERPDDYLLVQVSPGSSPDTATFLVQVPPGQPSGLYDSVISEPNAALLGVLTVNVVAA